MITTLHYSDGSSNSKSKETQTPDTTLRSPIQCLPTEAVTKVTSYQHTIHIQKYHSHQQRSLLHITGVRTPFLSQLKTKQRVSHTLPNPIYNIYNHLDSNQLEGNVCILKSNEYKSKPTTRLCLENAVASFITPRVSGMNPIRGLVVKLPARVSTGFFSAPNCLFRLREEETIKWEWKINLQARKGGCRPRPMQGVSVFFCVYNENIHTSTCKEKKSIITDSWLPTHSHQVVQLVPGGRERWGFMYLTDAKAFLSCPTRPLSPGAAGLGHWRSRKQPHFLC